jgi:hypothetical protein
MGGDELGKAGTDEVPAGPTLTCVGLREWAGRWLRDDGGREDWKMVSVERQTRLEIDLNRRKKIGIRVENNKVEKGVSLWTSMELMY